MQALYLRTSKWQALDGHQRFGSHEGDNKVTNPVCQNCESQLKRRREANDVAGIQFLFCIIICLSK